MTTLKQIQKLIDSLESTDDLNRVALVLKARHKTVQCLKAMAFRRGQPVAFTSSTGKDLQGKIIKINTKSIDVETPMGKWRVSPSMLKAVV